MGPVPPDPDDPDLWPEWDEADELWDDDETYPRRWPTPVRLLAVLTLVAFVLVYALSLR